MAGLAGEEQGDYAALMPPTSDDVLRMWPVSRDVNSVKNNRPDLLVEIGDVRPGPTGSAELLLHSK